VSRTAAPAAPRRGYNVGLGASARSAGGRCLTLPLVAGLIAACATLGHLAFQEPEIDLKEIAVTTIGLTGGTCDLVFDVWNPNAYRLTSTRMEVGIELEGSHFGDALFERPLDLSATAHSQVRVPVRFEWAGLGAGAKALLTKRAVGFAVTGRVLLDTPLGTQTVVLKGTGNVPLTKLLK
jgi:LEA14-like dessication related protein